MASAPCCGQSSTRGHAHSPDVHIVKYTHAWESLVRKQGWEFYVSIPHLVFAAYSGLTIPCAPAAVQDLSKWKAFSNRAGWSIKHPTDWEVGSCNSCSDPTEPDVLVSLYHPSNDALMMIQHLRDKPKNQTVRQWLDDVKATVNLNPRVSEEWIILDGQPALKVITSNPDATQSENIYLVYGDRTFYVSFTRNTPSDAIFRQTLTTLRFTKPK